MSRQPSLSSTLTGAASASAPGASTGVVAGVAAGAGAVPRYKAVTRDVLLSVCRKHFVIKTVAAPAPGRNFKGQTVQAKMEYAGQHGEGYDYSSTESQNKLETLERYLKRATHLQLDSLKLTHTFPQAELAVANGLNPLDQSLALAKSLRVLYLNANFLTSIDSFAFCADTLSHLYLQNNLISKMENILQLKNLEKLYLGGNAIQRLEGFAEGEEQQQRQQQQQQQGGGGGGQDESAPTVPFYLTELHMDAQRLPESMPLQLSIPSIQSLSFSLTVLSLQHNHMDSDSILPLSLLSRLTFLNLAHNRIDDLNVVAEMCTYLQDLQRLDLRENPISAGPQVTAVTQKKYRDKIIMSSRSIAMLDEKPVLDNQRDYLHSLQEQKRLKKAQSGPGSSAASGPNPSAAAAIGARGDAASEEARKMAAMHTPPAFPYAPKVLTLRTSQGHGGAGAGVSTVNFAMQGSVPMQAGTGLRHQMQGNTAPFQKPAQQQQQQLQQQQQQHQFYQQPIPSPFLDDDENLGGGGSDDRAAAYFGGGGGGGGPSASAADFSQPPAAAFAAAASSSSAATEGTASSMTFTGDPTRLNSLLATRGLVSAFGAGMNLDAQQQQPAVTSAESARVRRASMNSLNQAPNGWDGGRTQHVPPVHSRKPGGK